ncbi:MAG: bifunctional pyr operon transcriptional regulator/uracil phosphoribosyltransferase PyrR [Candidatus Aminicenantes bacterium]|nr:bifunctional pyr operon transcriptional regulator/uracil phosphoribosyltransferase PyrR [Candidatus Aminicenantes bacterium]
MKKQILSENEIERIISRICSEILERNNDLSSLIIIGIRKRGDILAKKIAQKIESTDGKSVPTSAIDITFYRDDVYLKAYKYIGKDEIRFDVTDKNVILVDDVIFTGRTIRAAIDVLIDSGRPKSIQLAVLIDRGSREIPIQPNYVGKKISAGIESDVLVRLEEIDGENKVMVSTK